MSIFDGKSGTEQNLFLAAVIDLAVVAGTVAQYGWPAGMIVLGLSLVAVLLTLFALGYTDGNHEFVVKWLEERERDKKRLEAAEVCVDLLRQYPYTDINKWWRERDSAVAAYDKAKEPT